MDDWLLEIGVLKRDLLVKDDYSASLRQELARRDEYIASAHRQVVSATEMRIREIAVWRTMPTVRRTVRRVYRLLRRLQERSIP